jgi:hypothetical protein
VNASTISLTRVQTDLIWASHCTRGSSLSAKWMREATWGVGVGGWGWGGAGDAVRAGGGVISSEWRVAEAVLPGQQSGPPPAATKPTPHLVDRPLQPPLLHHVGRHLLGALGGDAQQRAQLLGKRRGFGVGVCVCVLWCV